MNYRRNLWNKIRFKLEDIFDYINYHYEGNIRYKNNFKDKVLLLKKEIEDFIYRNPKKSLTICAITIVLGIVGIHGNKYDKQSEQQVNIEIQKDIEDSQSAIINMIDNKIDNDLQKYNNSKKKAVIKVEPTGHTYAELYKTIDKIKELASKYNLDYPILFDIEKLMDEETLEANCFLAEEFCNKLTANGFYVGLYGTDESMITFDKKFNEITKTHSMDLYDKLIIYEKEKPTYTGIFNMQQKKGKNIEFKYDLCALIAEKNLNSKENYKEDKKYIVQKNDRLEIIASSVGMKTSDLATYNDIKNLNEIFIDQEIIIPNQYQEESLEIDKTKESIDQEETPSETRTRLVKGIDVSEYQGNINWEQVASEVDFAIIRLCDFIYKSEDGTCKLDEKFYQNITSCEKLNIPVGVYYFSRATTKQGAIQEAKFVASALKEYSLEYPVYMDIETQQQNQMIDSNSKEIKEVVISAMAELEAEGYYAGVYCNRGADSNINRQKFINDIGQFYTLWLTSNATYNVGVRFEEFKHDSYQIIHTPTTAKAIYQYCQRGTIPGIDGNVDLNYGTESLTSTIEEFGYDKVKTR